MFRYGSSRLSDVPEIGMEGHDGEDEGGFVAYRRSRYEARTSAERQPRDKEGIG